SVLTRSGTTPGAPDPGVARAYDAHEEYAQIENTFIALQQARLLPIEIGGSPGMDWEGGALIGVRGFDAAHLGQRGDELGLRGEQQARDLACRIVRQGGSGHEAGRHR